MANYSSATLEFALNIVICIEFSIHKFKLKFINQRRLWDSGKLRIVGCKLIYWYKSLDHSLEVLGNLNKYGKLSKKLTLENMEPLLKPISDYYLKLFEKILSLKFFIKWFIYG